MLLAPHRTQQAARTARPEHRARRGLAVAAAALGAVTLLVATVWVHWGSTAAAVLTGLLVNTALAPLPHARPLARRPEPQEG